MCTLCVHVSVYDIQSNPSCEATPFAPEKWPFKRGGLSSGVEINTFMFRLHCQVAFPEGVASCQGFHCICLIVCLPLLRILTILHNISKVIGNLVCLG